MDLSGVRPVTAPFGQQRLALRRNNEARGKLQKIDQPIRFARIKREAIPEKREFPNSGKAGIMGLPA
jgi:hypothetical protein